MKKKDLKETLKQEIESEASALERRVNTQKSLASLEMPGDSYEDLMEKIREKKEHKSEMVSEPSVKILPFGIRRKALATAAMVAVLVIGAGLGVNGARVYVLSVEEQGEGFDIITDTENISYVDLTEEEAYDKIEEEIGILALRVADKPKNMNLEKVYVDAESGEAIMEFCYKECILSIYENKQNDNASFNTQMDGKKIDKVETFYLGKKLDVLEIDKKDGSTFYWTQLEYGNAYYQLSTDMALDEFKNVLYGLVFKTE